MKTLNVSVSVQGVELNVAKTARNKGATKGPCKITDNPLPSQQPSPAQ